MAAKHSGGGRWPDRKPNRSTSASWMALNWSAWAGNRPAAFCSSSHCHWKKLASYSEVGVS